MDANLVKLNDAEGADEVDIPTANNEQLQRFTDWYQKKFLDKEAFRSILEKSVEWELIDTETQEEILTSLDNEAVSKIIQITGAVNLFDFLANLAAGGVGLKEIFSDDLNLLESTGAHIFFGKLLFAPLFAYTIWYKNKIEHKHIKAATLAIPGIGGGLFPFVAFQGNFKKFSKVYRKVKKHHKSVLSAKGTAKQASCEKQFKEILQNSIKKNFTPSDYRERIINTLNAQNLNTFETAELVDIKKKITINDTKKLSPNGGTAVPLDEILSSLEILPAESEKVLEPVAIAV